MSHQAQNETRPAIKQEATLVDDTDPTEYQTLSGCLTLTALVVGFALVAFVFLLLFGAPPD